MNVFDDYPAWLLTERDLVNELLLQRLPIMLREPGAATMLQRCLLGGRKIRSIMLLSTLEHASEPPSPDIIADIIYAIECAHASSVLVDDILDGDSFRHGYAATQSVWGPAKSALVSHVLLSSALHALEPVPQVRDRFLTAYDEACWGEVHDVMLLPGDWIFRNPLERVYTKTTALFRFSFDAASYLLNGGFDPNLSALGVSFGRLYQYANDFFDWQPDLIDARHDTCDTWPITMTLPLARYLSRFGPEALGEIRNRPLSYADWLIFLRQVWRPEVVNDCETILTSARADVENLIVSNIMDATAQRKLRAIADLAITRTFWFHELKAA